MENTDTCNITLVGRSPSIENIVHNDASLRVIAVTSGNGGAGKTSVAINLATALSNLFGKVLLIDANFSLSNIDVALGLKVHKNIKDVLSGKCDIEDIIIPGPDGIQIIPAAPCDPSMSNLRAREYLGLIHAISQYSEPTNFVVIDTPSGIGNDATLISQSANHNLVIINDNPVSLKQALSLINILKRRHKKHSFLILSNSVHSKERGEESFNQLHEKCNRLNLDINLRYCGCIPYDKALPSALRTQSTLFKSFPNSKAANAIAKLAHEIHYIPTPSSSGGIELFQEHRLNLSKINRG